MLIRSALLFMIQGGWERIGRLSISKRRNIRLEHLSLCKAGIGKHLSIIPTLKFWIGGSHYLACWLNQHLIIYKKGRGNGVEGITHEFTPNRKSKISNDRIGSISSPPSSILCSRANWIALHLVSPLLIPMKIPSTWHNGTSLEVLPLHVRSLYTRTKERMKWLHSFYMSFVFLLKYSMPTHIE